MPRPPPARPPPTPLGHSPRRRGATPMPQPLFAGHSSRQHPHPRVPDHAATTPPESSGQPLPSSTREQIVSERWKKPQRPWRLKRAWANDRRRHHRTIHRRCLLLVILSQDPLLHPFLLLPRCWEETGAKDLCEGERKGRKGDRTGGGARLLTTGRRGSLSKRWIVPGWRLGWVVVCDPIRILQETKIIASITNFLNVSTDPATFVQGALPHILGNTKEDFFQEDHWSASRNLRDMLQRNKGHQVHHLPSQAKRFHVCHGEIKFVSFGGDS
uniref:Aminotransferase class I/classII large domain-containing protein n=1 Tax=Zea mays TaxID=4577 RepID=A0A804NR14_MAIZE